jgi:hypothetical protein
MRQEEIQDKVYTAIARVLERDAYLLRVDVNERSITHRLALYLQEEFEDWDVDCEYNRNREDTKRLRVGEDVHACVETFTTDDTQGKTVYPDIVVHHRGTDENLLVIEVKKSTSKIDNDFDLSKLAQFKYQLKYCCALFLKFTTGDKDTVGVSQESGWVIEDGLERL